MDEKEALRLAILEAGRARCAKSKRGVIIWRPESGALSWASNGPPRGFFCDGSESCRSSCGKVAVHAEQAALLNCLSNRIDVRGAEMLHTKVTFVGDQWVGVFSGGPSCPDCSKLIVDAGIAGMWLVEEQEGRPTLVRYTTVEFHRRTLANRGLHDGRWKGGQPD